MKNLEKSINKTFYKINGIGLVFLLAFLFLSIILFSRLKFVFTALANRLETSCGCLNHFSFYDHPFIFTSLILAGLGAIAFIGFFIIKTIKIKRSTTKFIKENLDNKKQIMSIKLRRAASYLKLENKVFEIDYYKPLVFCFGSLKPKICISSTFVKKLSNSELRAVLLHEQYHLLTWEPIRMLVVKIITKVLFFVPGLKSLANQYFIFSELAADDWAIRKSKNKSPLAQAVYKTLQLKEGSTINKSLAIPYFSNITEERINKIVDDKYLVSFKIFTPKLVIKTLCLLIFIVLFSLLLYSSNMAVAGHENNSCLPEDDNMHPAMQQTSDYDSNCLTGCNHQTRPDIPCEEVLNTKSCCG